MSNLPNKIPHYTRNKDREHSSGESVPFILWEHDKLPAEVWVKTDVGKTHGTWTQHYEVILIQGKKEFIGREDEARDKYGELKRNNVKRVHTLGSEFKSESEAKEFARQWMYDNPNPDTTYYRNYFVCKDCGSKNVNTLELDNSYLLICENCDQDGEAVPDSMDYEITEAEVVKGNFRFEKIID